jgi:hypothetical protein
MYTTLVAVYSRRKGPVSLCLGIAQKTLNFEHCMEFVAPQLVNVAGKMECGCITKCNSGYKKFVVFIVS